jgi:hypothetical protein
MSVREQCWKVMIVPKRFGLKYGPVPTIALEYEEDLAEVITSTGLTSVYVHRGKQNEDGGASKSMTTEIKALKKLHVVELPTLTKTSESDKIIKELQENNKKFLSPSIVKEDQLKRLLDRLIEHLQVSLSPTKTIIKEEEKEQEEVELSDESIEEASLEKEHEQLSSPVTTPQVTTGPNSISESKGRFTIHDTESDEKQHQVPPSSSVRTDFTSKKETDTSSSSPPKTNTKAEKTKQDKEEEEEDKEDKEEEIGSDELEYFSESSSNDSF